MPNGYQNQYQQQPYTPQTDFVLTEGIDNFLPPELVPHNPVDAILVNIQDKPSQYGGMLSCTFKVMVNNEEYNVNYICSKAYSGQSKFGNLVLNTLGELPPNLNIHTFIAEAQKVLFSVVIQMKRYPTITQIVAVRPVESTKQTHIPIKPKPETKPLPQQPINKVNEPKNCYWCGEPLPANPNLQLQEDNFTFHVDCLDRYRSNR